MSCPRRPPPAVWVPQQCGAFRIHQPFPRRRHVGGWLPSHPGIAESQIHTQNQFRFHISDSIAARIPRDDSPLSAAPPRRPWTFVGRCGLGTRHGEIARLSRAILLSIFVPQKTGAFFLTHQLAETPKSKGGSYVGRLGLLKKGMGRGSWKVDFLVSDKPSFSVFLTLRGPKKTLKSFGRFAASEN